MTIEITKRERTYPIQTTSNLTLATPFRNPKIPLGTLETPLESLSIPFPNPNPGYTPLYKNRRLNPNMKQNPQNLCFRNRICGTYRYHRATLDDSLDVIWRSLDDIETGPKLSSNRGQKYCELSMASRPCRWQPQYHRKPIDIIDRPPDRFKTSVDAIWNLVDMINRPPDRFKTSVHNRGFRAGDN